MHLPRPALAAVALTAMFATAAGCGSGSPADLRVPAPTPTRTSSAVIAPTAYADPFTGFISADAMMPADASLLAAGLARAAGWSGDPSSPAADVRAKLTYLFTEQVHLVAIVLTAIDAKGPHSSLTKSAQAGLEANSVALITEIKTLSRVPPTKKGKPSPTPTAEPDSEIADLISDDFATAWRAHITQLVDYAVAAKDKVQRDESDARHNLEIWRQSAASFLKLAANNKLRSTEVRDAFDKYLSGITDAADSLVKRDGKGYDEVRSAASAMVDAAAVLADGFARADGLRGKSNDDAATARAQLTYLLTEHDDLLADVVFAGYSESDGGMQSIRSYAARAALDANAKDLAAAFGKAVSAKQQASFLEDWRRHDIEFLDYAEAAQKADVAAQDKAVAALNAYRTTVGNFFATISGQKITAAQVEDMFTAHIASMTGEIAALAALLTPPGSNPDS
jgi:hypothetical protein